MGEEHRAGVQGEEHLHRRGVAGRLTSLAGQARREERSSRPLSGIQRARAARSTARPRANCRAEQSPSAWASQEGKGARVGALVASSLGRATTARLRGWWLPYQRGKVSSTCSSHTWAWRGLQRF